MNPNVKFGLVLAGVLAFLATAFGLIGAVIWGDLKLPEQAMLRNLVVERLGLLIYLLTIAAVAIGLALARAFRAYVRPPLKLAEDVRVLLAADGAPTLSPAGAPEFAPLVASINLLAEQREALRRDTEARIAAARSSVEEERNRLAALMSELTQSVVVCNMGGRILLYNNRARWQFQALADAPAPAAGALIGLGRSIFAVFDRNLIAHALDSIQTRIRRDGTQPVANFVTTTRAGQLIRVQMAPVLSGADGGQERQVGGYVLVLENITRAFETESRRDQVLQSLTEGSRAALGNIRAAVESLLQYPDVEAEQRDRFLDVIGDEARALSQRLDRVVTDHADSLKARWPLEDMLGADLIQAVRRRIEQRTGLLTKTEEVAPDLWVKVDSFSLLQGLAYLAARLKDEFQVREVRFRLARAGRLAQLDLIWSGAVIGTETLVAWELEPMELGGEANPLTLREIVERHGGEIWFEREKASHRAFFRLLVPAAAPQEAVEPVAPLGQESRPEYYDFDLFRESGEYRELDDIPLGDLTYTVFDTETTGLEPSAGDEIIQIGAMRIVNGRLLRQESYEQLVNPNRPLARESARIHGITETMLQDQPSIGEVLPAFHAFCADTVLVAHNAAFDLRFLQLKEEATGVRFPQPVLDTMLLSPIIHPNQDSHRLEAIAERLGVSVIGRHTALGDAIVTGEVFLRMIPLLVEKGIRTLGQARAAAQQTYYARIRY